MPQKNRGRSEALSRPSPSPKAFQDVNHSPPESLRVLQDALLSWRYRQQQEWMVKLSLVLVDALVLWACFLGGRAVQWMHHDQGVLDGLMYWWSAQGNVRTQVFAAVTTAAILWLATVKGHYTPVRRKPWWDEIRELLLVLLVAAMADAVFMYLGKWQFSRLWTGTTWVLAMALLPLSRLVIQRTFTRCGRLAIPYVIVGSPSVSLEAIAALSSEPLMGYRPIAWVHPPHSKSVDDNSPAPKIINIKYSETIREFLQQPGPYLVVIAQDNRNDAWLRGLAQELMLTRSDVMVAPALGGLPLLGMEISHFFSHDLLLLRARNNLNRRAPQFLKRVFDLVMACLLVVMLSPLMLWVAWQIRREDGGPVFFVQQRVGKGGKLFSFIKFRSMVVSADAALANWQQSHPELYARYRAGNFKLEDDPRITRVGRWIRRTSVDELPQLLNVLRGDMSLVGPRPLLSRELPDYGPSISTYHMARPGITGLWQISGRSNTTFAQRIAMDLWYVRNWSLWYDFVIMMRTFGVVLRQEGAV